jgi:hypothetical protein
MKRGEVHSAVVLGLALAGAACGHAHTTDSGAAKEPAAEEPAPQHHHQAGATKREPSETPVAGSADALLKSGAEEKIREKLHAGDEPLSKALKQFQRDHDLPVTGQPDHETVSKLGLKPDDIFQRAVPTK